MRMAVDQFVAECVEDLSIAECFGLFGHDYLKRDMQKEVSQLFFEFLLIPFVDSVHQLITLFKQQVGKRLRGLFPVPRTFGTEHFYQIQHPVKFFLQ